MSELNHYEALLAAEGMPSELPLLGDDDGLSEVMGSRVEPSGTEVATSDDAAAVIEDMTVGALFRLLENTPDSGMPLREVADQRGTYYMPIRRDS